MNITLIIRPLQVWTRKGGNPVQKTPNVTRKESSERRVHIPCRQACALLSLLRCLLSRPLLPTPFVTSLSSYYTSDGSLLFLLTKGHFVPEFLMFISSYI